MPQAQAKHQAFSPQDLEADGVLQPVKKLAPKAKSQPQLNPRNPLKSDLNSIVIIWLLKQTLFN